MQPFKIHTHRGVFYEYDHVDVAMRNRISNELYTDLQIKLHKVNPDIKLDDILVIMGMMCKRMAVTVDLCANHGRPKDVPFTNMWESTIIHEFCSMLIPDSGLSAGEVEWRSYDDLPQPNTTEDRFRAAKEVEDALRSQYPGSEPISRFANDLHRPAKSVHDQRDRERDYVARKFEQSCNEADRGEQC